MSGGLTLPGLLTYSSHNQRPKDLLDSHAARPLYQHGAVTGFHAAANLYEGRRKQYTPRSEKTHDVEQRGFVGITKLPAFDAMKGRLNRNKS